MPVFEVGQCVWVYTPKINKGLSKKLLHNWFGPSRIVEQYSPVHFRFRTDTNKKVTFAVHANRMKLFINPDLIRPIDPPLFDDLSELYLDETDIPNDSFEKELLVLKDDRSSSTEQAIAQSQSLPQQVTIDNQAIFHAEKILKS